MCPTDQQIQDAAKKTPANRSPEEQLMVDKSINAGNVTTSNLDHAARATQRVHGS